MKSIGTGIFARLLDVNFRVDRIKQNPEKAEKYVWFGIKSIIESVILFVLSFFILRWVLYLFSLGISTNLAIIGNIFVIMIAVAIPFWCLYIPVDSLINSIAQMRVNKKKIGWISLIISILFTLASVGVFAWTIAIA